MVGVPDPQWGEVVTAVVVCGPGADRPDVDGLRALCEGRLAGFKQPRRVAVVDALPRTAATGQIQRTLSSNGSRRGRRDRGAAPRLPE